MPSRIGDALHWYATYTPNKIAIISSAGTQTYAQLWSRVCRLGSALTELGLVPGDRIGLPPRLNIVLRPYCWTTEFLTFTQPSRRHHQRFFSSGSIPAWIAEPFR